MSTELVLRKELLALLKGGQAHLGFKAFEDFPLEHINTKIPNMQYTFWQLLEHIRRSQKDILEFIQNPVYEAMRWPQDYWPAVDEKADELAWQATLNGILLDRADLELMIQDESIDLLAELPYAPGYTYLRELLLVADHNAYHIGEFSIVRGILGFSNNES